MAKKEKKAVKASVEKATRWTVRGVPARLQKAAGDLARARGQTLGQWLSEVVETAVANAPDAPVPAAIGWRQAIEDRLATLEALAAIGQKPAGPAARRSRRADRATAASPSAPA